jgi:hypothetical protein
VVSSADWITCHFSGGSGGKRSSIVVIAGQSRCGTGLSPEGATFMALGTFFLRPEGRFLIMRWLPC